MKGLIRQLQLLSVLYSAIKSSWAWNIVIAGGTGPVGQALVSRLHPEATHSSSSSSSWNVTILARNSFLASTPTRVSHDYGWIGDSFLQHFRSMVQLRDWDGGDLLDIVGQDWIGWQEDTLSHADCVIHCTGGGYMGCYRSCHPACQPSSKRVSKSAKIWFSKICRIRFAYE
jgi:hypothetical protein